MHRAHLFNYPGIRSISGNEFLESTRARSVIAVLMSRVGEEVTDITPGDDGSFQVKTDADGYEAEYVVLATGTDQSLATDLGVKFDGENTVDVDLDMETSIENLYAMGAMVRAEEWQAVIVAGVGRR